MGEAANLGVEARFRESEHHNVVNNGHFLAQGFHCTEQDLIDEFPATLFGKIQKCKIRESEIETRCLQSIAKTATA